MKALPCRLLLLTSISIGFLISTADTSEVDLRPTAWPPGDLEHYSALQSTSQRDHPPAEGVKGMVVGTTGSLAIRAGVEALRQGGTAIDAACTTALAQITLIAGATVSFAGKMALVYYDAETGDIHYLNGAWDIPRGQGSGLGIPACGTPDGRQVLVHGFMAALEAAHNRFGALPFESLFGPAIYFAEEGFEIDPMLGSIIAYRLPVITRLEGGRKIFLKPDGRAFRTGDWFRQPLLAETLTRISQDGAANMYSGSWAEALVEAVEAQGGSLSLEDLQAYRPTWLRPLEIEFAGHVIHAPSEPGYGGQRLLAASTALASEYLLDSGHQTVSADSLASLLRSIEVAYGYAVPPGAGGHSDGVVAIDARGNIAAMLHTINTNLWGDTGIFIDGVSISDPGCWAQRGVTQAGPGGRLPTAENPLIVTSEAVPVAATSAIGSALFPATLFGLVDVLVFEMNPFQTLSSPTFLFPRFTSSVLVHRTTRGDFSSALLDEVRGLGFFIEELSRYSTSRQPGWCVVVTIDPESGVRKGATPGDFNGIAMAEEVSRGWRQPLGRIGPVDSSLKGQKGGMGRVAPLN